MTIQGNIIDEFGDPIPNLNILEVGTTNGTITDLYGNYTLTLLNNTNKIQFSHVGFKTQLFSENVPNNITMLFDDNTLDQVTITATKPKPTLFTTTNVLLGLLLLTLILKK